VIGVWESLEIRVLRKHEIVGSNPATPTYSPSRRKWNAIAVVLVLVRAGGC
jgi:hypothetical protein